MKKEFKNLKIMIWVTIVIIVILVITSCYFFSKRYNKESNYYTTRLKYTESSVDEKQQVNETTDYKYKTVSSVYFYEYVDKETGVHYLIYSRGGTGNGGITPRLNSDGSIMIGENK